ncbi:MAG: GNAT family N-acetyltransferase [Anaerolineales bacterium]|nr:GNAT family N-acetyltransferase [Anaerolineales bacterium]
MIRPYQEKDFEPVARFWFDAVQVAEPELVKRMNYEFQGAREFFKNIIVPENKMWVYEINQNPVGFLAMQNDFIDRLYVHPQFHRQGIGTALIEFARTLSPNHLWLYTDQANKMSRAFYEKNGFIAEKFGVSPPPESEPDVEYHWYSK